MNKQELIDYCNAIKENKSQIINCIDVNGIIKKIEQLDEPQKPVVPQFVADWYEEHKDYFEFNLWDWIAFRDELQKQRNIEFNNWLNACDDNPIVTLVNMHQFGYEVEEEKRYLVKVIGLGKLYECLNFDTTEKIWKFFDCNNTNQFRTHHTRKELEKAGFGEVFDSTLFEVEEVEE